MPILAARECGEDEHRPVTLVRRARQGTIETAPWPNK
jgi:hypothetical protein